MVRRRLGLIVAVTVALVLAFGGLADAKNDKKKRKRRTTPTVTLVTATTIPTPATPPSALAGSSVVSTPCPVERPPRTPADLSTQSEPVARAITIHEYPIEGVTKAQLRAELSRCGPRDDSGDVYDGLTDWYVSFSYRYGGLGDCRIASAKTRVDVDVYIPRWINSEGSEFAATWNGYFAALMEHEAGHSQLGLDAAQRVNDEIRTLPPSRTCPELERAAGEAAQRVIDDFARQDGEYDARTSHGATQGAVFG